MDEQQLNFRKVLQDSEVNGWRHFDDYVLKLSAGGLAGSLTLLGLTKDVAPASMWLLYGGWTFWAASLVCLVFSILTGQLGLRSQIAHFDAGTYYSTSHPEGPIGRLTLPLNVGAIVLCGLGFVWLSAFALYNVSGGGFMPNDAAKSSSYRELGQPPLQAPPQQSTSVVAAAPEGRGQVTPQSPSPGGVTLPGAAVAPQAPPAPPTPPPPSGQK